MGMFYLVDYLPIGKNRRYNEKRRESSHILPDFVGKSAHPGDEIIFQQDGDTKHTAKIVKEWLANQKFKTMEWPAQSPDLNPIENLWALLKIRLARYENAPQNLNELWSRVQAEWANIPKDHIENLVDSMPKRVKCVIKAKDLWTKYSSTWLKHLNFERA